MEGETGFKIMLAPLVHDNYCQIVRKEIRFANASRIVLNHLQNDRYLPAWQGVEIHVLAIDQLEQFSEEAFRFLRANTRILSWQPPPELTGFFPKVLTTGNPGGISHQFVKDYFVGTPQEDRAFRVLQPPEEEKGGLRIFIPSRLEDNPALQNDPEYAERLEGLGNPDLVRALREGDWEVVVGSMFGYIWRKDRHVCDPFVIPASWEVWRGGDDGFNAPAAIYWLTQDPDSETFYVIDEIYETGLLPNVLGERIIKRDFSMEMDFGNGETDVNDAPVTGVLDSAAFSDIGSGNKSRGDQMNEEGCNWRPVSKPVGSRVMRCQMMHQVLAPNPRNRPDKHGVPYPGIIFFRNCVHAILTIPALPISEHNPEDVDTSAEDHAFDAISYGLTHKMRWFAKAKVKGI
jgi:hypothetical protein